MTPDSDLAFLDECFANIALASTRLHMVVIRVSLGKEKSPDHEDDGWTGAEPKQGPPSMWRGIDEATGEGSGEKVSECVTLLKDTTHQASGLGGKIF